MLGGSDALVGRGRVDRHTRSVWQAIGVYYAKDKAA